MRQRPERPSAVLARAVHCGIPADGLRLRRALAIELDLVASGGSQAGAIRGDDYRQTYLADRRRSAPAIALTGARRGRSCDQAGQANMKQKALLASSR